VLSSAPSCASRRRHAKGKLSTHWRTSTSGRTRSIRFADGMLGQPYRERAVVDGAVERLEIVVYACARPEERSKLDHPIVGPQRHDRRIGITSHRIASRPTLPPAALRGGALQAQAPMQLARCFIEQAAKMR